MLLELASRFETAWHWRSPWPACSTVRSSNASLRMTATVLAVILSTFYAGAPSVLAQEVQLSVDAAGGGAKIDRNLFGQFAEHLGHGVYEGIWVGPDSAIPN